MSEHYYSKDPQSKSSPKTWTYSLRDQVLTFTSDIGVFSKNEVDFGSKTLIEAFTEPELDGLILDLGCGYGPIGLSVAKSYPKRKIVMVDINQRALELARLNANANEIKNISLVESNRFQGIEGKQFAAILTNPPIRAGKQVVTAMLEESFHALLPGGELWVVIQKKQGAPSAQKKMETLFGEAEVVTRNKGYYILHAKKFD